MSRVVPSERRSARRAVSLTLSLGLLVAVASAPAVAQDLPACDGDRTADCVLPSLFGEIQEVAWIEDDEADAPEGGLDILSVGIGRVQIDEPASIRTADGLLKLGKAKKAVPAGAAVLVRVELDAHHG